MDTKTVLKEAEFVYFDVADFAEELIDLKDNPDYKDSSDLAWCELSKFAKLPDVIDLPNGIVDFNIWDNNAYVACLDGKWVAFKDDNFCEINENEIYYFSDEASKAVAKVAAEVDWKEVE